MKKLTLFVLLLLTISCSEQVMIEEDPATLPGKIGIDTNYIPTETKEYVEPYGDCFCKTTVVITTWFGGVERLEAIIETPVGCVSEKPYWTPYDVFVYAPWDSLHYKRRTDCKTELEWDNYWDQCFHYDNEWFLCDYCLPYPVPYDIDLEAYGAGSNCLRE